MTAAHARLASVVMFVSELERSVHFYTQLFALEVTIRNETIALLVGPDGSQLYLRAIGNKGAHPVGSLGAQYVLWSAESEADFDAVEASLRKHSKHVIIADEAGFRLLESRDPDDLPVIITYPGPSAIAREKIIARIYEW